MINIGVLGSTKGTDLQAILDAVLAKKLEANISVVISNQKDAYILKRARDHGVPTFFISHKKKGRVDFDAEMTQILRKYKVDLILLIGFMRILSSEFCREWSDRILNVHPSLLPKFKGLNTFSRMLKNKEKNAGCTVHFVSKELDSGEIIVQKKFTINSTDDEKILKKKTQQLEYLAFPEAIIKIFRKN